MVFRIDDAVIASHDFDLVIVVHDGKVAINDPVAEQICDSQCLLKTSQVPSLLRGSASDGLLSLGTYLGQRICLVELGVDADSCADDPLVYLPFRDFISQSSADDANIVSRAAQLVYWRTTHRFCSRCGVATALHPNDRAYTCVSCGFLMYPRISPCVIGIVTKDDSVLLARSSKSSKPIYSAIAGFIEAGETPEQAFAREVAEEVGLSIQNIEYLESQTWPFPSQLMLGFLAEYESGRINIDEREISHADWFHKDSLPMLPPPFAISAKLIEHAIGRMK